MYACINIVQILIHNSAVMAKCAPKKTLSGTMENIHECKKHIGQSVGVLCSVKR